VGSFFSGLRGRLLLLTAGLVLLAELIILTPLVASYRDGWLRERASAAQIAALAVEAAPDGRVSDGLSRELLAQAQVVSVAVSGADFRELILAPSLEITGELVTIDMRGEADAESVIGAFGHIFAPSGRFLRILVIPSMTNDLEMEIIVPEDALRSDLIAFSRFILSVSLLISAIVGALVYFSIYRLVVRPIEGLTRAVIRFADAPEAGDIVFRPGRSVEMRRAYDALQIMRKAVETSFRQKKRLADLGEAVAKINHDLRNSLAAAKIVSEGLSHSEDPGVRRSAPRLERAIERAIGLAETTLRYGKAAPPEPALATVNIVPTIEEAAADAIAGWGDILWRFDAPEAVYAVADAEHVHRIIGNLVRNAARAVTSDASGGRGLAEIRCRAVLESDRVVVELSDNGPGIPPRILERLFQPFSPTASRDGVGLGLAIARELARGMRGELELAHSGPAGAVFVLTLPAGG
jgi:hypothetical protein